jgi:hypothetical protein
VIKRNHNVKKEPKWLDAVPDQHLQKITLDQGCIVLIIKQPEIFRKNKVSVSASY